MVFVLLELLFLFKSFVMLYKVSHLIIFTLNSCMIDGLI